LFEIVFIGSIPNVNLGSEIPAAFGAFFPIAGVLFGRMESSQRVMVVISMAAVARIREHNVLVLVIADPVRAAFRLHEV
jgi:hypothetical protein